MTTQTLPYKSLCGAMREARLWLPQGEARAVVQIAHGMAEHIARYEPLAQALTDAGFAVCGHNHEGHGGQGDIQGYFAQDNGWDVVVEDIFSVQCAARERLPDAKFALLGHSMGSFAAREFALRHAHTLSALVLSGTGWHPPMLCRLGGLAANLSCLFGQRDKPAPKVDKLAFSANNKQFEPSRTPFDWLSRDNAQVDKYIADPDCGFVFTGRGFSDLFHGLMMLSDTDRVLTLPKSLPIYMISGDNDPVGGNGKGVTTVYEQYKRADVWDVTLKLYPGARHELFNETNREEVISDLIAWLNAHMIKTPDDAAEA